MYRKYEIAIGILCDLLLTPAYENVISLMYISAIPYHELQMVIFNFPIRYYLSIGKYLIWDFEVSQMYLNFKNVSE